MKITRPQACGLKMPAHGRHLAGKLPLKPGHKHSDSGKKETGLVAGKERGETGETATKTKSGPRS